MTPHPYTITLREVTERSAQLPSFPVVVQQILAALDDDDATLEAVVQHVQHDPVVAARVLAMANSPLHHVGRDGVRDVFTAISLIGLNQVRQIALSASLTGFIQLVYDEPTFLGNSLAVAICMEELAKLHGVEPAQAFVTGLLHDVGTLWLHCFRPEAAEDIEQMYREGQERDTAERATLGMSTSDMGRAMAVFWHLPADLCDAIAYHRHPTPAHQAPLVVITHLARAICHGLELPGTGPHRVDTVSEAVGRVLGPDWWQDLPDLMGRVAARYRFVQRTLQASTAR